MHPAPTLDLHKSLPEIEGVKYSPQTLWATRWIPEQTNLRKKSLSMTEYNFGAEVSIIESQVKVD